VVIPAISKIQRETGIFEPGSAFKEVPPKVPPEYEMIRLGDVPKQFKQSS
jgi:hypothetical protein